MPRVSPRNCCLSAVLLLLLVIISKQLPGRVKEYKLNHNDVRYMAERFKEISPLYNIDGIDCRGVLEDNNQSMSHALAEVDTRFKGFRLTEEMYQESAKECDRFITDFGYITYPLTQMEEDFPLAYSMVVFKDIEPVERLLRAVYRPQNLYCLHVDIKAKSSFYDTLASIADCFPNVFIAERRVSVEWAKFSVLEAELVCMEELWRRGKTWRYFINLTGQEFPLKTNRELVEILLAYRGANDVEGVRRGANKNRWDKSGPAPDSMTPTKGSVHVVLNREFIDFILHRPEAQHLIEWAKPQETSDETFFATLNHNPHLGIKGSFIGLDDVELVMARKPWFGRYKAWLDWPCAAIRGRDICILTTGDLPRMHRSPFLFANKFYLDYDRLGYGCLEQRLFNRTRDLFLGKLKVDTTIYEQSVIVRNRLVKEET